MTIMTMTSDLIVSDQLPYDILALIFSFLSLEDHIRCLLVSKPWFDFIIDLQHFSKLCLMDLPSFANKKELIKNVIQQLRISHQSSLLLHGSSYETEAEKQDRQDRDVADHDSISQKDMLKFINYILKNNNIVINSVCFKNWTEQDQETCKKDIVRLLTKPSSVSAFMIECTTMVSCYKWYNWTSGYYRYPNISNNLTSITIIDNQQTRTHFKENGWFAIDDSFPRAMYGITRNAWMSPLMVSSNLTYFKLSTPSSIISNERIYPNHGSFSIMHDLVDLYLDSLNHQNPLVSAKAASSNLLRLQNIVIAPLAEMPCGVRYDPNNEERIDSSTITTSRDNNNNSNTTTTSNEGVLRCFVWTMGNSRPKDPNNFYWYCKVNKCKCFKNYVGRILEKHYQHLELLYLQYDGQHGIAFRSIRFLQTAATMAIHLREIHFHATGTLFAPYHRNTKTFNHYGFVENFSQYLAEAIPHLPALEIIVLKNEEGCCLSPQQHNDKKSSTKVATEGVIDQDVTIYMIIDDNVLQSLAKHCSRLKEVVIWGPYMNITSSAVVEFAQTAVSVPMLELLELNCLLSDTQIETLLHFNHNSCNRPPFLEKLKLLKLKDRSIILPSRNNNTSSECI
ncbi:hypothetical protein BDA99DRAFT_495263 [Phascolomyces articulosus]|uniref:F-box domain-containing protein n=1 Tax=Phascolomyces articulosus TaxID=60185 RepID=A0AAD5KQB2_9FUNG|nr:hypothetical protein BDA99DRAFT_495263 [Phascolomyces articulosus]